MKLWRLLGPLWELIGALSLGFYGLFGPLLFSRRYFEYRYRKREDPWEYESSPYERRKYQKTLEILPKKGYRRALEVGCSIGVFTEELAKRGIAAEILGIDISQKALDRAGERLAGFETVRLKCLDITRDPLEGSYDLIFCAEVLFYLGMKNVQRVRDKLIGALEEGGHIVLVDPWPLSRKLHGVFQAHPGLQLISEHVEPDPLRPYAIALFQCD
jgi:SAM-dependent methyltransferase